MKLIYIASPYTLGDKEANVLVQIKAVHRIMDMGHAAIAPLLNHFCDKVRLRHEAEWLAQDFEMLKRCDIVLRLPGESKGADAEVGLARAERMPVAFGWRQLRDILNGKHLPAVALKDLPRRLCEECAREISTAKDLANLN